MKLDNRFMSLKLQQTGWNTMF